MGKVRGLQHQLQHAISQGVAFGESKHGAAKEERENKLYSLRRTESLRKVAAQLAAYIKQEHPEVRLVREIRSEHLQGWIASRQGRWTAQTLTERLSELRKLDTLCRNAYGGKGWGEIVVGAPERAYKVRNTTMSHEDYMAIRDSLQGSRSAAKDAIEITARSGLRVNECACLRGRDIDTEKWTLYVSREGAKNGRSRTLEIRPEDRAYYADLKARAGDGYVCGGIKADSINRRIRDRMQRLGISSKYPKSTEHAVRKMYAQRRMAELRGPVPLTDQGAEMRAFDIVSAELGHGEGRTALYNTYILGN